MSVDQEMRDIEATIERTLDVGRRRKAKQTAKSRIEVYRKALSEVQRIAGDGPMRELADWIREQIGDVGSPPSGRAVRKQGAALCRASGEEVSTGSWLGA